MPFNPTYGTVHSEGCDIRYWHQGSGPLLMMVPGGGGIGRTYNHIFEYLSDNYHVCTMDRRQNSESKVPEGQYTFLNMAQQARDVIAVMKALGYERMHYFGNSGGGIIGLQLAVSFPEKIEHIIVHEAPTIALLPDHVHWMDWTYEMLAYQRKYGNEATFDKFRQGLTGFEGRPPRESPSKADMENFWTFEYIVFNSWVPDLRRIKSNNVSIAVAAGELSQDAWYARTTLEHKEIIGCPHYMFPGHHTGFELEPEEFSHRMLSVFDELKQKRRSEVQVNGVKDSNEL